jgi:PIN domain nuclease of toxin-antitoxin system
VKALFDTNCLLRAVIQPERLSAPVAKIIAAEESELFVSAASAWEIATKVRSGKLSDAARFEQEFIEILRTAGYTLLPIGVEDALRARRLAGEHRDPFDRMIAAQATAMDIPVLSMDAKLDAFGVRRIW